MRETRTQQDRELRVVKELPERSGQTDESRKRKTALQWQTGSYAHEEMIEKEATQAN